MLGPAARNAPQGKPISLKIACAFGWFSPSALRFSVSL